ncbi:MAG: glycine cleavage system protein GcvH [Armatimonadota bacterium]|nr:glycine cleavage system protein GcvH [Armatimonadota bacterium]
MNVPDDLFYTKSHEWVRIDGEIATIGITDFAQSELGDIVYVDLPSPGRALQVGDSFATVESVKTVSDVYTPLAGEVSEANADLEAASELMNSDPYGGGWLIKMTHSGGPEGLLSAAEYLTLISA